MAPPQINAPSFRFPFDLGGKAHPDVVDAIRSTYNGFTVHEQAFAHIGALTGTTSTSTNSETISETAAGVTSFNSEKGAVNYFPSLGLVNNQIGANPPYITQTQDNGALVLVGNSTPDTVTLNYAVSTNYFTTISNAGTGDVTIIPDTSVVPSTINGASSFTLPAGSFVTIYFDGTNWWADSPGTTVGGVTELIAGTNITLSPSDGKGSVTVNAAATAPSSTTWNVGTGTLAPQSNMGFGTSAIAGVGATTPLTASFVGVNANLPTGPVALISLTVLYRTDVGGISVVITNSSTTYTWTYTGLKVLIAAWV